MRRISATFRSTKDTTSADHQRLERLRLINDTYKLIGIATDKYFGWLCLLTLILAVTGWTQGLVEFISVLLIGFFLIINLVMTKVAGHFKSLGPYKIEIFRIFIINGILCPIIYVQVTGPFSPWWPGYMIFSIGTALVLGIAQTQDKWIKLSFAFWTLNLSVAAYLARDHVSVYQFAIHAGTSLVVGLIFLRMTHIFAESVFREYKTGEDLRQTLATLKNTQMKLIQSEKFSALGQMAAGIAHEINNPLAVISLNAELIQQLVTIQSTSGLDSEKVKLSTATISASIQRIEKIILGLKTFSRNNSLDPFSDVSVQKLFNDFAPLIAQRFQSSNISLQIHLPESDCVVQCRPGQIMQVLMNLLDNSFDAVLNQSERWVKIGVTDKDSFVQIQIQDSGPIIPNEVVEHIFQPFFTTKPIGQGTGLGLSISKGIVENHRGTIYLENRVPHTSFLIQLPKTQSSN